MRASEIAHTIALRMLHGAAPRLPMDGRGFPR